MAEFKVSENLKNSYDSQYDESTKLWREKSAKNKAQNILELTEKVEFNRVLEVGSGDGSILAWLELLNFNKSVYSLEISESGVNQIKLRNLKTLAEVKVFDGYNIPYGNDFFDLVICSHVMEHVEFPRMLLREIKRVSKFQVFEIPIDFSFKINQKVEHFLSYGHINIYSPGLFKFLIKSEGFNILNEIYGFYNKESIGFIFRKNSIKYYSFIFKKIIIKSFPFLRKIKPDIYAVLCSKSEKGLNIF